MTKQYKVWGDFLVNLEAEDSTEAEQKVEEVLDELFDLAEGDMPAEYSIKPPVLERKIE